MKPRTYIKQSWESRILEVDCSQAVPSAVSISSIECKIFDSDETDQTSTMIEGSPSFSGTTVYAQVKAGTSGSDYNLRVRLTLGNGELAEDDLIVQIRDRAL